MVGQWEQAGQLNLLISSSLNSSTISRLITLVNTSDTVCAEDIDLFEDGIEHSKYIDPDLIENLLDVKPEIEKDKNQRKPCGCVASVDISAYNTCGHGCLYCYANYSRNVVNRNRAEYNLNFPSLCSKLTNEDVILEKNAVSCAILKKSLFD